MKGETTGGKRDSSASRVKREEDTSATRRSSARTLGQMATVSQRQTQLIPQPKTSRAMAPVEPASRRSLLPIKPQRLSHVWRARALVAVVITVLASVTVGLIQAWQLAPHTSAQAAGLGNAAAHALQTEVATPGASGHGPTTGPWAATAASVIVINAPPPAIKRRYLRHRAVQRSGEVPAGDRAMVCPAGLLRQHLPAQSGELSVPSRIWLVQLVGARAPSCATRHHRKSGLQARYKACSRRGDLLLWQRPGRRFCRPLGAGRRHRAR